jgi:hypothetical protein
MSSCMACGKGNTSATPSSCSVCAAGRMGANAINPTCDYCSIGQAQPLTGKTRCNLCSAGTFANVTGRSDCFQCKFAAQRGVSWTAVAVSSAVLSPSAFPACLSDCDADFTAYRCTENSAQAPTICIPCDRNRLIRLVLQAYPGSTTLLYKAHPAPAAPWDATQRTSGRVIASSVHPVAPAPPSGPSRAPCARRVKKAKTAGSALTAPRAILLRPLAPCPASRALPGSSQTSQALPPAYCGESSRMSLEVRLGRLAPILL